MKILLDTSAYVGFKRNTAEVVGIIVRAESILFSPVVLGELMFGFRSGTRCKENMEDLDSFLQHEVVQLVQIGKITSDRYSRIAVQLKRQGTPIPTNDIWIAAQTMEHGAELITSDQHFEKVNGLVCTIF
ncbi:MAG: type II toxin-antitoxin system VapC family toxin [Deltaproteobacteria bacterium]|nr:type II toxin-antitoxin system VapC family toxin [Deltaproteobacteria bacterium]RLB30882.1 MAG: type II toxin-antitoxin system VapC family toxin [Deltaproteobacteria bacterium]